MLSELEDRRRYRQIALAGSHPGNALAHPDRGRQIDPAPGLQLRLVIVQIELRRAARLVQEDDPLRCSGAGLERCGRSPLQQ